MDLLLKMCLLVNFMVVTLSAKILLLFLCLLLIKVIRHSRCAKIDYSQYIIAQPLANY